MARSLGFAAYRAFSRRQSKPPPANSHRRPEGEVLWLHATTPERVATLFELGKRVQVQREGLTVLITSDQGVVEHPIDGENSIYYVVFSSDHPGDTAQFLDHWRPDICLWAGVHLMPNLISQAAERAPKMILIDVEQDELTNQKHKWFPALTRESLEHFATIITTSSKVSASLRRIGLPAGKIRTGEPLRNGPSPPPISEDDIAETSQQLLGRSVWLAAYVQSDEIEAVLTAHRIALRLLHRLLLVVTLSDAQDQDRLTDTLNSIGLRFALWGAGDPVDDNIQVLISHDKDDQRLWYRMAPLTFMASSLHVGSDGRDPSEPVSLGSAILFGPHVSNHREVYSRLAAVGAGRSIGDADGLGAAVVRLAAPDAAATMALEGWQVVTQGAGLTDQLVDLVQDHLDNKATGHARP